jgi:hypothetical protein
MTETSADGQDALRLLARAARALVEEGSLSTEGLLPAWRILSPQFHPGARHDVVDVATVARCRALGGDALLRAETLAVRPASARAPLRVVDGALASARDSAAGDALALALALSLETAKLSHGLPVPDDALRAAFATPAEAQRALHALRSGGVARNVDALPFLESAAARIDPDRLTALAADRPCYVVVGAGARRIHDLLSPFARRLRAELTALGGAPGARGDESYAGIAALYAADDARSGGVDDERSTVEASEGFSAAGDGALAVLCEKLAEGEADARVRDATTSLKRARALLVLVEERASSLRAVLDAVGASTRAVLCVVEASDEATPSFVLENASDHVAAVTNALSDDETTTSLTLPSFAFHSASTHGLVDDALFPLAQQILHARARGVLSGDAKVGLKTVRTGDVSKLSLCCIELLGRLGPSKVTRR